MDNFKEAVKLASSGRSEEAKQWIERVREISNNNFVALPWFQDASIQSIEKFVDRAGIK